MRCLLQVARVNHGSITIPEIARLEGLTEAYVGKLLMVLRRADFINSTRGHSGGYTLGRDAREIAVSEVLASLGGRLIDDDFCARHSGAQGVCAHKGDCSVRWVWNKVQGAVDASLAGITLHDILVGEEPLIQVQIDRSMEEASA